MNDECFSSKGALIEEFMKSTIQSNNLQKKKGKINRALGPLEYG